jgi:replicative DNA helicase
MEMPAESLTMRILSSISKINQNDIRTGQISQSDWPRLSSAIETLSSKKLLIDDTGEINIMDIRSRAKKIIREYGHLELIVIDYLQLMHMSNSFSNRATEVSLISRSLKILSRELDIPIIVLSQLNRNLEQRNNKRPFISDLRESGSIEQDADLIIFIYRDEIYNKDTNEKGIAEIIIGKQRNGEIGTIKLTFLGQFARFENYKKEENI